MAWVLLKQSTNGREHDQIELAQPHKIDCIAAFELFRLVPRIKNKNKTPKTSRTTTKPARERKDNSTGCYFMLDI